MKTIKLTKLMETTIQKFADDYAYTFDQALNSLLFSGLCAVDDSNDTNYVSTELLDYDK